jgi:hypothetical protein
LLQGDQLAQQVRVAQGVCAVFVAKVGTKRVVQGCAREGGHNANGLNSLLAALLVMGIEGQRLGTGRVQPVEFAVNARAGLVKVSDGCVGEGLFDGRLEGSKALVAGGKRAGQRAFRKRGTSRSEKSSLVRSKGSS